MGPELAVADGALGFWQAVEEVWPEDARPTLLGAQDRQCLEQAAEEPSNRKPSGRCRRNLDGRVEEDALAAFDAFIENPAGGKSDKAVECLSKDRDAL